jgi:membrane-associated phospholipid phosphatase
VIRPDITSQTVGSDLLRWVYAHDQPYNAFPSSHVYLTVLCGLLWMRWKPGGRLIWMIGVLGISLSTLFTKQHYLLDVISGATLAGLAYIIGIGIDRWWEKKKSR